MPGATTIKAGAPNTAYTITVSVADEDDSATPTTLTRSINVVNIVPTIVSSILSSTILAEGGQTTLDIASVRIEWYPGKSVIASVDSDAKTFRADFTLTDDYPLGTSSDSLTLLETITDSDGGSATTSRELVVYNVVPRSPRCIPARP